MDLIFTNPNREDVGVLHNYELDLAFGSDENNFECTVGKNDHCCSFGSFLYIEGTEYGGIIDGITSKNSAKEVVYTGRTWHGILNSKVLQPDSGQAYLTVSGEANAVIASLIARMGLSDLFEVTAEDSGLTVNSYQMNRYISGYEGILKMLKTVGGKLLFCVQDNCQVLLSVVPVVDYTQEELDSDLLDLDVKKTKNTVNHLICLGSGELENRMVIHLYADENGNISQTQTFTGRDEYVAVLDYSNAQDEAELISSGIERLTELMQQDDIAVDVNEVDDPYDIGDVVGAFDNVTNIKITVPVTKKIVTIRNGVAAIDIQTDIGDASVYSSTGSGGSGSPGADGQDGQDGKDGADGVSCTHEWNGTVLTVTSASGTSSADLKGEKGDTGSDGADGVSVISVTQTTTSTADGGTNIITAELSDGTTTTFEIKNGSKGSTGETGATGNGIKTAVLNSDYTLTITFTDGTSYTTPSIRGEAGATGATGASGADGVSVTHEWNGTVLTITSASGTSSADLKGEKGDPGESSGGSSNITFATEEPAEDDGDDGELRFVYTPVSEQEIETPKLPNGYTELEYIESSGTQSINTGVSPTSSTKTVIDITPVDRLAESAILGSAWSASGYFLMFYNSVLRWHSKGASVDVSQFNTSDRNIIEASPTALVVNGTSYAISGTGTDSTEKVSLFTVTNNAGYSGVKNGVYKLYSCQIYDNGTLVRDFVPCMNASGEVGLYDLVNSAFYADAAGGTFAVGDTITYNTEYDTSGEGFFKKNGQWYTVGKAMTTAQIRAICT